MDYPVKKKHVWERCAWKLENRQHRHLAGVCLQFNLCRHIIINPMG